MSDETHENFCGERLERGISGYEATTIQNLPKP